MVEGGGDAWRRAAVVIDVLVRGLDDWIQAMELSAVVGYVHGRLPDGERRRVSLEVIAELVEGGLMIPGDLTDEGFAPWELSTDAALARIEKDWDPRIDFPDLGEVCWLANTPAGDERARAEVKARSRPGVLPTARIVAPRRGRRGR